MIKVVNISSKEVSSLFTVIMIIMGPLPRLVSRMESPELLVKATFLGETQNINSWCSNLVINVISPLPIHYEEKHNDRKTKS